MKLLKEEVINLSEDGIEITTNPVTTTQQASLIDTLREGGASGKIAGVQYMLRNVVSKLVVNGEEYNPVDLARLADINDPGTVKKFLQIGIMVDKVVFPTEEEKKS